MASSAISHSFKPTWTVPPLPKDIFNGGDIQPFIQNIQQRVQSTALEKIYNLLDYLSQVRSVKGSHKDFHSSLLKAAIYSYARINLQGSLIVLDDPSFKYNSAVEDVREKIQYLSQGYFGRFAHHFPKRYLHTPYFYYLSLALCAQIVWIPYLQLAASNEEELIQKRRFAAKVVYVFMAIMALPLLRILHLARKDEP